MPPRGVISAIRKRQYAHIKESEQARGEGRAEEIGARTVTSRVRRRGSMLRRTHQATSPARQHGSKLPRGPTV
jgi:hypothetical protein